MYVARSGRRIVYRVRVKMVRMKGTRAQQERSEGIIMVDEEWPISWRTASALHGYRFVGWEGLGGRWEHCALECTP